MYAIFLKYFGLIIFTQTLQCTDCSNCPTVVTTLNKDYWVFLEIKLYYNKCILTVLFLKKKKQHCVLDLLPTLMNQWIRSVMRNWFILELVSFFTKYFKIIIKFTSFNLYVACRTHLHDEVRSGLIMYIIIHLLLLFLSFGFCSVAGCSDTLLPFAVYADMWDIQGIISPKNDFLHSLSSVTFFFQMCSYTDLSLSITALGRVVAVV